MVFWVSNSAVFCVNLSPLLNILELNRYLNAVAPLLLLDEKIRENAIVGAKAGLLTRFSSSLERADLAAIFAASPHANISKCDLEHVIFRAFVYYIQSYRFSNAQGFEFLPTFYYLYCQQAS